MSKVRRKQKNFSVSQKYEEVWSILDKVDNQSEFICEAILEKFNGTSYENRDINIKDEDLKETIKKVINEMFIDDVFIVKGSVSNLERLETVKKNIDIDNETETTSNEMSDDLKDTVKGIIGNW